MLRGALQLRYANPLKNSGHSLGSSACVMEKADEKLQKNPYYGKYAEKIASLQKVSPEEFLTRMDKVERKPESKKGKPAFHSAAAKERKPVLDKSCTHAPEKKLDSIMKTEMLDNKSPEEIKYIWTRYFSEKDTIYGVLSADLYKRMHSEGAKFSTFVFPLPRSQGYEFILSEFKGQQIHFTPLISYQAFQENAPECLTMFHYPELMESKGIVLMHGEFDKNLVNVREAQFLANQVQMYYGGSDHMKSKLLEQFHKSPDTFKHMDLIAQIEKVEICTQEDRGTK